MDQEKPSKERGMVITLKHQPAGKAYQSVRRLLQRMHRATRRATISHLEVRSSGPARVQRFSQEIKSQVQPLRLIRRAQPEPERSLSTPPPNKAYSLPLSGVQEGGQQAAPQLPIAPAQPNASIFDTSPITGITSSAPNTGAQTAPAKNTGGKNLGITPGLMDILRKAAPGGSQTILHQRLVYIQQTHRCSTKTSPPK